MTTRNDARDNRGVMPRRGLWLVSRARARTYGEIDHVKRDGTVVWRSLDSGSLVKSDPERLRMQACTYETAPLAGEQS